MLEKLKNEVYKANMALVEYGLVRFTWGNVSGIDREAGLFVIKPSGVEYEKLTPDDMVVVDMSGQRIEGRYKPSSDTATHLELYKAFAKAGGIVHTHSIWMTSWAQAGMDIPAAGTTHADYFFGAIPCTSPMRAEDIAADYELNTGLHIAEEFKQRELDPEMVQAVNVHSHGPFVWGSDAANAVHNAAVAELVAEMAFKSCALNPDIMEEQMDQNLMNRHFFRKHGKDAYYGQS